MRICFFYCRRYFNGIPFRRPSAVNGAGQFRATGRRRFFISYDPFAERPVRHDFQIHAERDDFFK